MHRKHAAFASTEDVEGYTNEVIVFGPAGSVAVGVTPLADLAGDAAIGVLSSVDPAGVVTAGVALREDCGDGVVIPGDYDCVCDYFAEVTSLAEHAGGVTVDMKPPAG